MHGILLVLALFAQFLGQSDGQSHHCHCANSTSCYHVGRYLGSEDTCEGLKVISDFSDRNKAEIDCNGRLLDCAKLPHVSFAKGRMLRYLTVHSCEVRSLTCVLPSLNASGVITLNYSAENTPLSADLLSGLDMVTSLFLFENVVFKNLATKPNNIITRPTISSNSLLSDTLVNVAPQNVTLGPSSAPIIPIEAIQSLPRLIMLRINKYRLTKLPSNAFKNSAPKLNYLDVTSNNITIIEADAFQGLIELKTLELNDNPIEVLQLNAFRGLVFLEELHISESNLSVIQAGLFSMTPLLQELVLQSNSELSLEPAALSNLTSLTKATIWRSGVKTLPGDLFLNTTAVIDLNLSRNKLRSLSATVFAGLSKLLKLDLSYNKLESVEEAVFKPLQKIQELHLDGNLIQVLKDNTFSTLTYLSKVYLSDNRLYEIQEEAFNQYSITTLDLSNNRLTWCQMFQGNLVSKLPSPLKKLKQLQRLILRNNSISDVCGDWIEDMNVLQFLDISFNNITILTGQDLNFLSHNIVVNVQDNNITTIKELTNEDTPQTLQLGRNLFNCDCDLYEFLHLLKKSPYNLRYKVDQSTCHTPRSLKGCNLTDIVSGGLCNGRSISLSDLTCPVKNPSGCDCLRRPSANRTECECDQLKNKTLLYASDVINEVLLKLHSPPYTTIPSYVTMLNLSNSRLDSVPDLSTHLKFVDLGSNSISRVPVEFLQRNITIKLANNPLECECSDADDVENLQKYQKKIKDYKHLLCKNGIYVALANPYMLCYLIYAYCAIAVALVVLFLASTIIVCYKYKLHIRLWLVSIGFSSLSIDEMDLEDKKKTYDIFLSFVHQDAKFVKEKLLPKLQERYKVCIHTRDWIIGDSILDQIYRSVADSRRTLVVLSNEYIQSGFWAQEEFRAAYLQTAQDRRQRCVVILLEDVDLDHASEDIKLHIKLNTYIEWKDSLFWERLYEAIPKKLKVTHLKRRRLTERAIRILGGGRVNQIREEIALMSIPGPEIPPPA